jgi:hypothetical protein
VGNATDIIPRLGNAEHETNKHCECEDCTQDRVLRKCPNPHSCATAAQKRLGEILPKWDPRTPDTYRIFEQLEYSENSVTFRDTEQIQTLAEGFRVFTKLSKDQNNLLIQNQQAPTIAHQAPNIQPVNIYVGAASHRGGDADAAAGIGIFYSEEDPRNQIIKLPAEIEQSVSAAEILAAIIVLRETDPNAPLHFESHRNVLLKCPEKLPAWEDRGWVNIKKWGSTTSPTLNSQNQTSKHDLHRFEGETRRKKFAESSRDG